MNKLNSLKPMMLSSLFLLGSLSSALGLAGEYNQEQAEAVRQKDETKGVLSGAVIGGILAGPPGAIFLAGIGGLIGNSSFIAKENTSLLANLNQSQARIIALQEQQEELAKQYQLAQAENQALDLLATNDTTIKQEAVCCNNSVLEVHFKTNSADIEEHYQDQLQELVDFSDGTQGLIIEVTGYADRRGSSNENYLLSQNRVKTVQNKLIALGISHRVIQTSAYGENQPLSSESSLENDFFDRRVNIRFHSGNNEFITQSD